jgi:hypothetical protein
MENSIMLIDSIRAPHLKVERCKRRIRSSSPAVINEFPLFWFLPREIIFAVLSFLPPKDLARSAQVCREWRLWAYDETLWKQHCFQVIGDTLRSMQNEGKSWREIYLYYALHPKFICAFEDTLRILDKGMSVKVKSEGWPGYKTAISSSCASTGVHFWRVQLRPKLLGWLSVIGLINEDIAKSKIDLNCSLDEIPGSFGYFYDGKVVHFMNGTRSITHGCGYGPGDIIMVFLDLNRKMIALYVCSCTYSKITHVTTFEHIKEGKYRLAVSLNYQETEAILLENIKPPPEVIPFEGCEHTVWHKHNF